MCSLPFIDADLASAIHRDAALGLELRSRAAIETIAVTDEIDTTSEMARLHVSVRLIYGER